MQFEIKNVRTISTTEYKKLLEFLVREESRGMPRNVVIYGPAGIGKTKIAQDVITASGLRQVYVNLSVMDAMDFLGIPQVKDGKTVWAPPDLFTPPGEKSVVLFDETDKAAKELQAPLLEFVQDRTIMGKPTGTEMIVMTANMPDEGAFSMPISRPVLNRSLVFVLRPDVNGWLEWARGAKVHPLVTGFISKNQDMLLMDDDDLTPTKPSPRSWVAAARAIETMEKAGLDSYYYMMAVEGYVGSKAATKMKIWLDHYVKVDPIIDDLFAGKKVDSAFNSLSLDEQFVFILNAGYRLVNAEIEKNVKLHQSIFDFLVTRRKEIAHALINLVFPIDVLMEMRMRGIEYSSLARVSEEYIKYLK